MSILEDIKSKKGYNPKNSVDWFMKNVSNLSQSGFKPMNFLGENRSKQVRAITVNEIGKMIQFFYSPKHKETLPVYDTFPLVLPFSFANGYMHGLNIHYMAAKYRLVFFDKISSIIGDDKRRRTLTWELLKKMAKMPQMQNCVKSYILKNIKSNIIVFDKEDYVPAIFLPSESFKKMSSSQVWAL